MAKVDVNKTSIPTSGGERPGDVIARDAEKVIAALLDWIGWTEADLAYREDYRLGTPSTLKDAAKGLPEKPNAEIPGWEFFRADSALSAHYQDVGCKATDHVVPVITLWTNRWYRGEGKVGPYISVGGFIRYSCDKCGYCGMPLEDNGEMVYYCPYCGAA